MANIAVLGAGVVGLSTALNIQKSIPGAHVTLVADTFNEHTTSDGAGAIIVPFAPGVDEVTEKKWCKSSMDYFIGLAVSEDSAYSGVSISMGFMYLDTPEPPPFKDLLLTFDRVPQSTADILNMGKYYCYSSTTVMVGMRKYLRWLMDRFVDGGGKVIKRHVGSLGEFVGSHDLVVNCAGYGARDLIGDDKMQPVKGQTMRVSAPWVNHFMYTRSKTKKLISLILPNSDNVLIGGTKEMGTDTTVDAETSAELWRQATELWPPLKKATPQWEWVGIRPHRVPFRVESEVMKFGRQSLKVVHNYGHGSLGVSVSWGTALHAAELAKSMLCTYTSKL